MEGSAPTTRFRHTACPMACTPGSLLWHDVKEALGPATKVSSGQLLFVFGGYNTMGEEFGADSTFVSNLLPELSASLHACCGPLHACKRAMHACISCLHAPFGFLTFADVQSQLPCGHGSRRKEHVGKGCIES